MPPPRHLLITMPVKAYDGFLERLAMPSRSYDIMIAASIQSCRSKGHLKILCRLEEAQMLLVLANALYPDAAPAIAEAIDFADQFPITRRALPPAEVSIAGATPAPYSGEAKRGWLMQYRKLPGPIHQWHCDPSCPEWPQSGFMEHTAPDVKTICPRCASVAMLDSATTEAKPRPKL